MLLGDGELMDAMKEKASNLGIKDRVTFGGYIITSMIIVSRKTIKVNIYHKDALSIFLAAAFMTVILVWCHRLTIGVSTWISLIFEILVAGIVYFCCIFMFKNTISKKLVSIIKRKNRN